MACPVLLALSIRVSQSMSSDWVELIVINAVFVLLGIVLERYLGRASDRRRRELDDDAEGRYEEISRVDDNGNHDDENSIIY